MCINVSNKRTDKAFNFPLKLFSFCNFKKIQIKFQRTVWLVMIVILAKIGHAVIHLVKMMELVKWNVKEEESVWSWYSQKDVRIIVNSFNLIHFWLTYIWPLLRHQIFVQQFNQKQLTKVLWNAVVRTIVKRMKRYAKKWKLIVCFAWLIYAMVLTDLDRFPCWLLFQWLLQNISFFERNSGARTYFKTNGFQSLSLFFVLAREK